MATISEKNIILRLQADTKRAQRDISRISKDVTGLSGVVRNAASTFAGLFAFSGAQAVSQQLSQLTRQSVGLAISAEQTAVAFETFLGSATRAREVLAQLNEFSRLTPFEPEQVIEAGKSLLAFGIEADKLTETLTAVGNIAAGTGNDFNELAVIFGKARTQGRIFAEDINQLTERGIPIISELAKQFGVAEGEVRDLVSAGRVEFANLERAFQSLTSEGGKFFNLIEKQSQTVGGRISTLVGNFNELLKSIGQRLLPVIGDAVDGLNSLVGVTQRLIALQPSDEFEQQAASLQALTFELNRANTSEERRAEIIDEINRQYPKLLNNQDIEAKNYAEITRQLQEANKALIARAVVARQEEQIAAQIERAAAAQEALNNQVEVQEFQIARANELLGTQVNFNQTLDEQRTDAIIALREEIEIRKQIEAPVRALQQQLQILEGTEIARQDRIEQLAFSNQNLVDQQLTLNQLTEQYANELTFVNDRLTDNTSDTDQNTTAKTSNAKATKKQTEEEKALAKARADAEKELARLQALAADAEQREVFREFQAEIDAAVAAKQAELDEIARLERGALEDSREFDRQEREDGTKSLAEDFAARQLAIENQILARKQANQEFKDLEIELLEARLDAAEIGSLEAIKIEQDLVDARRELEEEEFNRRVERAKEFIDISAQLAQTTVAITKDAFEQREAILDDQIRKQEQRVEDAVEIAKNGNAELLQAEEDRLTALKTERERNAEQLQRIAAIEVAANQAIAVSQGIVAVTRAFSTGTFVEGIAASVALAATIASSVIALNNAFAGIQGFAEGTEFVEGAGSSKSDSIPAMLSRGERVVPAATNAKYFSALNEFQNETPKADMMAAMLNGDLPRVSSERVTSSGMNTRNIEKQLQRLNDRFDALQMQVVLDKDGFSASLSKYRDLQDRRKKLIQ